MVDIGFIGSDRYDEGTLTGDPDYNELTVTEAQSIDAQFALFFCAAVAEGIRGGTVRKPLSLVTTYPATALKATSALVLPTPFQLGRPRSGGVELYVASGSQDLGFDIVQSGDTLRDNELVELQRFDKLDLLCVVRDSAKQSTDAPYAWLRLGALCNTLANRWKSINNGAKRSYTQGLMACTNKLIKKMGEEAAEKVQAVVLGDADNIVAEVADSLLYDGVALAREGKSILDAVNELVMRNDKMTRGEV